MAKLNKWLKKAAPAEKLELARRARTSVAYLRQLASGHRTASAEMAGAIETATALIGLGDLPVVFRNQLSPACKACPYFKQCPTKE